MIQIKQQYADASSSKENIGKILRQLDKVAVQIGQSKGETGSVQIELDIFQKGMKKAKGKQELSKKEKNDLVDLVKKMKQLKISISSKAMKNDDFKVQYEDMAM